MTRLSPPQARSWFADRQKQGFNAAIDASGVYGNDASAPVGVSVPRSFAASGA